MLFSPIITPPSRGYNSYLAHSNGVVPPKGGEVEVIRIERCLSSLFKEAFELVARSEPLVRRSNDENLVAAGGGAALPLRDLAVPTVGQRVVLKQRRPVWIDDRTAARWNPTRELLLVHRLGRRGGGGRIGVEEV